jgi:YVTN family beta-propeller protein
VAVSADGRTAVVADYGAEEPGRTLTVLDLVEHSTVKTIDLGAHRRPHGILFLGARPWVLVTTEDSGSLLIVDIERGEILDVMETGGRLGHMVAVTPDFARAYVPNMYSDDVAVFDLQGRERIARIEVGSQPEGIDVSPDGAEVWVTNRAGDTISVLDAHSLEVLDTVPCSGFPIRLKFTPDGARVLVSNAESGDVAVLSTQSRQEVARIPMTAEAVAAKDERLFGDRFEDSPVPVGILVHPDGKRAWVANTNADVISVLDLTAWTLVDRLAAGEEPDGLGFSRLTP